MSNSEGRPPNIYLSVPVGASGELTVGTHRAICDVGKSKIVVHCGHNGSSALTFNFNVGLCEALNRKINGVPLDAFVMIHTDVIPESSESDDVCWLDKLYRIFEETKADILSVVIPIKDERGLTSTAIDTNRWAPRRLTMTEIMMLPPTFDGEFIRKRYGANLLLNTGLFIMRLNEWATRVCFNIDNAILRTEKGGFQAFFEPEDWKFSRWANAQGLKLWATREIPVAHVGRANFTNQGPWGVMQVDNTNLINAALAEQGQIPK